jgi:hypothetical protein
VAIDALIIVFSVVIILRAVYYLQKNQDPLQAFKPFWEKNQEFENINKALDDLG